MGQIAQVCKSLCLPCKSYLLSQDKDRGMEFLCGWKKGKGKLNQILKAGYYTQAIGAVPLDPLL